MEGEKVGMPQNKRESLIYTVLMCFVMVLWMSVYNVALQYGKLDFEVITAAWVGFPIAYVFAMCCDWFFVSKIAKGVAFGFLVKPEDSVLKKVICVSSCMVVPMVIIMSLYGAMEGAVHTGDWSHILGAWLYNIPRGLSGWNRAGIKPQHSTANPLTALLSVCIRKAAANGSLFFYAANQKMLIVLLTKINKC